ncbi:MAG: DNA internalization-related competence protein ComEC/Rec2 [Candidatus Cloacimonetes bacterium]|jgi:competence protein ComEC|nr:DNA internalization-related competence protein ComEC/Rec2 [Candidatus Cloacimonadota bacterium]MDD4147253.1 DNA internalization-related competence protein ComEC/Rec2 [Candidatus Cloacimonadota bacterium]MDD4560344.1 DNA internalization-related competence protein ComEC/Rec2 [Candidatus Cloacimonadota bacterium]
MLWPVVFWVAGIIVGHHLQVPIVGVVLSAMGLAFAALALKSLRSVVILMLFFSFGILRYEGSKKEDSGLIDILNTKTELQQRMQYRVDTKLGDNVFQASLMKIADFEVSEKVLLYHSNELDVGHSYSSLSMLEPSLSDPLLDIYPQRFKAVLRPVLPPEDLSVKFKPNLVSRVRTQLQERMDRYFGAYSPLAKALVLSDTNFKREHRLELSRAGITHLIVVSGLHVMMLSMIFMTILRLFFPLRPAEGLFMIFLLFFAALNNWAPPILRAMLMIDLLILSRWLSRHLGAAQNLSVSLFVITLINPAELFQLGLQLSFLSVALIVFALPQIRHNGRSVLRRTAVTLSNYMLVSFVVGLGIAPLTLYYFGTASLNGILANLLGIPLMTLLLALSIIVLLFPFGVFICVFKVIADIWQYWTDICAQLPFFIEGYWVSLAQALAAGLFVFLLILLIKGRFRLLLKVSLPLVLLVLVLLLLPAYHKDEVIFFNAGVADCSLIFDDLGHSLMIDTGGVPGSRAETDMSEDSKGESWMQKKLLIWLARNRIRTLDYLLVTHLHTDHAGGLSAILSNLNVKNLIISKQDLDSDVWQSLAPHLSLEDTNIVCITDTMSITMGNGRLKILHPDSQFTDAEMNNQSVVCRYDTDALSFLFTGDIEKEAEDWLLQHYPAELKADILKVAHHGSRGSSSTAFLDTVKPIEAVFPSSKRNVYGFPHPDVVHRMNNAGTMLRYTYNGSIRYRTR